MIKFENTITPSAEQWKATIMGARNALNSWDRYDSFLCTEETMTNEEIDATCGKCLKKDRCDIYDTDPHFIIGPNDYDLMKRLRNAGTDHRKFMRMITVYVDITAPLYWWKEFDTYKVGTVANSCSTMHKIHAKEFDMFDFSFEKLIGKDEDLTSYRAEYFTPLDILQITIDTLNGAREKYLETKDKKYWWQMIQLLPSSYNQKRTVMLNYEVLANMYKSRKNHRLDEWHTLCSWIETLPYHELITGEFEKEEEST